MAEGRSSTLDTVLPGISDCCEDDLICPIFRLNILEATLPVIRSPVDFIRSGERVDKSATDLDRDLKAAGVSPEPASVAASSKAASRKWSGSTTGQI